MIKLTDDIKWVIPLYKIYNDDEDLLQINKTIKRGSNWAIGPEIEKFEDSIARYVGAKYCVALNSGTSALHATLLAYGLENQEVIVPSFSFISTANAVLFVNGKPIFSDIEEDTFGLDPSLLLDKISSSTKAIMPMDYGGLPCKIDEIQKISKENNLVLIEDAAESLGASINGKKIGTISDSSIFSFCGNKVLTTGEGGAVVTNSKEICEKIKLIRSHGRLDVGNYFNDPSESSYTILGYNWRMSAITAALGIAQLSKLDKIIKMRQKNANYLSSRLEKFPMINVPKIPEGKEHVFQLYSILLPDTNTRDSLHEFLLKKKIFSKVYFTPIHKTEFYKQKFGNEHSLPNTEKISGQILTLPMYPNLTKEEMDFMIEVISEFFELNETKSV